MLMNFTQTKKKCHPYTRNKKASENFAFSCYNMQMKMKFSFRVLLTSIWIESHLIYLRSLWLQNPALLQLSIKEPMPNHIKEPHTIVFYFLRMITKNDLWAMRTYVHIFSGVIAHSFALIGYPYTSFYVVCNCTIFFQTPMYPSYSSAKGKPHYQSTTTCKILLDSKFFGKSLWSTINGPNTTINKLQLFQSIELHGSILVAWAWSLHGFLCLTKPIVHTT